MKLVLFLASGSLENRAIKHLLRFCRVVPIGMVAQWALLRATPSAESHQPRAQWVAQTDSRGVEGRRGETAGS
jgi:hypothetical protein